tara:strand:+ start:1150 stop:1935 length:786 start_codon:yes stop_codon:yes gene_type:complete
MKIKEIKSLFDFELESQDYEDDSIQVLSSINLKPLDIFEKVADNKVEGIYEVTPEVNEMLLNDENYDASENFRNELTLLNAYCSKPSRVLFDKKKLNNLTKGDLILISGEGSESIMFLVFQNNFEDQFVTGHPVVEDVFLASEQSIIINPKMNSLNTEIAVLAEYLYDYSYNLINLDEGYLGNIDINDVELLLERNINVKKYKKIQHPIDSRDPHRSSLLTKLNYFARIDSENYENVNKISDENFITLNKNLILEREFINE